MTVESTQAAWREAQAASLDAEEDDYASAAQAEDEAWDAYVAACEHAGICLQADCQVPTADDSYCRDHRLKDLP